MVSVISGNVVSGSGQCECEVHSNPAWFVHHVQCLFTEIQ